MDLCTCNLIGINVSSIKAESLVKKFAEDQITKYLQTWYSLVLATTAVSGFTYEFNTQTKGALEDEQLMWEALKQIHEQLGCPGSSAARN